MIPRYVRVAVNAPMSTPLTYLQSPDFDVVNGDSVIVPLGKRKATGVVIGDSLTNQEVEELASTFDLAKIKSIEGIHPDRHRLPSQYITWAEKLARYYAYPLGPVLETLFPPLKRKGRKTKLEYVTTSSATGQKFVLTPEQEAAFKKISASSGFQSHLLFGITGSGKTEVYLQLLQEALNKGQQGLLLVPEISLTPQLLSRFTSRFGERVAVLHSHLTDRDRTIQWYEMLEGKKDILIGARSALFCPLEKLGIIVIDEEHEASFKQDEKFRYHARDSALMLAQELNIPIVLGSATPSLESWHNALSGKFQLHKISKRATDALLPEVEILDLRTQEKPESKNLKADDEPFWLTETLNSLLLDRIEKNQQSALFLNRRGQSQTVLCPACGTRKQCPDCSIGLTLHGKSSLICHYCDYHETMPEVCDVCRESELRSIGLGTEKVEEDLRSLLPSARILRADRDEIQSREDLEDFIQKVESREADIIVGTQMIAKGLDFPHLTLVGILLADISLNLPDFRSSERSFQLMTQVAGRAGRAKDPGKVILQTYNPDHPAVIHSAKHDFESFAKEELTAREELGYPPFGRLMLVKISGVDRKKAQEAAAAASQLLESWISKANLTDRIELLGPAEAPIAKLRGRYRFHLLVKAPKSLSLSNLAWSIVENEARLGTGIRVQVDVDPLNMM